MQLILRRNLLFDPWSRISSLSRLIEFVATMLTALVQFGNLMSIRAGSGAIAFASVVILTIFAAKTIVHLLKLRSRQISGTARPASTPRKIPRSWNKGYY